VHHYGKLSRICRISLVAPKYREPGDQEFEVPTQRFPPFYTYSGLHPTHRLADLSFVCPSDPSFSSLRERGGWKEAVRTRVTSGH
jgi:hypothetical protein